ncbi:DUF3823 domain-containing protein [Pedobacter sp. ISL-68]|uniref:DUF3823 domain-containing protein n=1 Tax=unclassified Pedobacter TaxID=2628915 RepID=UPI001BEBAB7A|nr:MULTISPECIES: DUF3823 domain-containing protein [unclassified Pedobacter]MBT2564761.1 DUF3823 domain-containing protein [Pedobacter sp. ISL-64]MBT2590234.1 DUF3823 domain-containing protein [Pedobacter sp. ISL-68]
MKNRLYFIIGAIITVLFSACKKDNYEAPAADFTGRIVYKGEAINVQYRQVNFELWQSGFGNYSALNVYVNQDGNFSAKLFDGNYKLVFSPNQGPFLWKKNAAGKQDTIAVNISGNKVMDIEVMSYYMIRGASLTAASGKVNGFCKLEKIITDANAKDIESVSLYINKTQFVDGGNNIGVQELRGAALADLNNLNMSVSIPTIVPTQNYVFARIGVKIAGVDDLIFTPVTKVSF